MKRMKSFFLLLAALMFMPMAANAGTGEAVVDGIQYWIDTDDKTAEVRRITSNPNSSDVVIPETIELDGVTCYVTSIGDGAFQNCTSLTSITIPNSVTSIGRKAFAGCSGLTSITIPNSITTIGMRAFYGCSGLTSITIPNSITTIGEGTFYGCSRLTSVTIPNSVTSIGESVFYNCI